MKINPSHKLLALLTKKELATLRSNYDVNNALLEQGLDVKPLNPVVKFFNPTGIGTWYLTELSPNNIGFGLCHLHEVELGYICLKELGSFRGQGGLPIEKDRYFSGKGLSLSVLSKKLNEENRW